MTLAGAAAAAAALRPLCTDMLHTMAIALTKNFSVPVVLCNAILSSSRMCIGNIFRSAEACIEKGDEIAI